jgi:AraC family transcriptional regulator
MAMSANQGSQAAAGVYGRNLGGKFGAEDAPCIVTRSLQCAEIAVTEVCVDRPLGRLSDPLPRVEAYMICLLLRDLPSNSYWEDGRQVSVFSLRAGQVTIHDLRREPLALMDKPIHSLLFYLPSAAFDALADQTNVPRISELRYNPGMGVFDEAIKHIGLSLLPALRTPDSVTRLFTDHVTLALAAHTAQTYGGMQTVSRPLKGGLAPWQERRSKEMIASDLTGATSLQEVAAACGLSVSHFSRAFSKSTGVAPHGWLLLARVESAKVMLRKRDMPLTMIAHSCGFADRSHLTRVFKRHIGLSPGVWRKMVAG